MDMYKQTLIYLYAFFVCLSLRANYFHKNETLEMSTPNIFAKNGLNNNFASSFLFCFDFENYNCSQAVSFASEISKSHYHFCNASHSQGKTICPD